jgi:hypothetical protein
MRNLCLGTTWRCHKEKLFSCIGYRQTSHFFKISIDTYTYRASAIKKFGFSIRQLLPLRSLSRLEMLRERRSARLLYCLSGMRWDWDLAVGCSTTRVTMIRSVSLRWRSDLIRNIGYAAPSQRDL